MQVTQLENNFQLINRLFNSLLIPMNWIKKNSEKKIEKYLCRKMLSIWIIHLIFKIKKNLP